MEQTEFLSELMIAGQEFCGEDWSKLKKKYQSLEEEELLRYCFSSAYIVALLHDSLGIALDDERYGLTIEMGWVELDMSWVNSSWVKYGSYNHL